MTANTNQNIELVLTVQLTAQASQKLAQLALEGGRDVTTIAAELLERVLNRPSLEELLSASQADFATSGLSEDAIMELGRSELESLRAEKVSKM